jgi:pimeloyl-ACP methyl ester carboxylesterase
MQALTLGPTDHERVVLFAAGAGGDPERYRPLLDHLAAHDCQVIAPFFERFIAREATTAQLLARPAGLVDALHRWASPEASVTVVGHSIGGWAGLCLAGATPWGRDGKPLEVPREPRVSRLALYAPAVGWFAAPGALDAVTATMLVYAGDNDTITPVEQIMLVKNAAAPVDLRVVPGAGHFSFMDTPPPGTAETEGFDRAQFLTELAQATAEFATAP